MKYPVIILMIYGTIILKVENKAARQARKNYYNDEAQESNLNKQSDTEEQQTEIIKESSENQEMNENDEKTTESSEDGIFKSDDEEAVVDENAKETLTNVNNFTPVQKNNTSDLNNKCEYYGGQCLSKLVCPTSKQKTQLTCQHDVRICCEVYSQGPIKLFG